jgi:hypothetical protein
VIVPSWLRDRPTDRRGIPVPYINQWGAEAPDRWRIAHDRHVHGPALFLDDDPDGEPDFTRQNMARQRECMVQGLCQVCAHRVPWSRRWLVVADVTTNNISALGQDVAVIHEPWLCQRCAEFALEHCPALIRRRRTERLLLVPVPRAGDVRVFVSKGYVDPPAACAEESRRVQPAMWVKVALPGVLAAGKAVVVLPRPAGS